MNFQIISEKENPIFYRKELKVELSFDKIPPSRLEIRKELSKQLGANEDSIIVESINNQYGKQVSHLLIYVYDNNEYAKKIESKAIFLRHMTKEEKEKAKEVKKAAKQAKKSPPPK
ncbi:MAG: hypothetical protein QXG00_03130 [Candidatus Woesearchaeota archaeon]